MGKRKERRLAAKMAANRRVKLDIFAEPSGAMVGTSSHNEVGRDIDQDHRAVDPNSPSSSGQGQENPLLLLGQYSDDELDEETSKRPKLDSDGSSSDVPDLDGEDPAQSLRGTEKDINGDKQQLEQVDSVENVDGDEGKEKDSTATAEISETDPITQINEAEPSGIQVNGDLTGGWKLVMHEESNQYYYWNTATGETSWEVPTGLAGQAVSGVEGDVSQPDAHLISMDAGECSKNALEIKNEVGEVTHFNYDANQALAQYSDPAVSTLYADSSALSNFGPSLQTNAGSMGQLIVPRVEGSIPNDEDKDKHLNNSNECYGTLDVQSSRLVKCCESLLQRLEALDRSGIRLQDHEWIKKEIEIRLSDCNALSSYGSSLLPFWWHTEAQLIHLESAVSKGEASLVGPAKHDGMSEATPKSPLRDEHCFVEHSLQSIVPASEATENKGTCHSPCSEASNLQTELTKIRDNEYVNTEVLSPSIHQRLSSECEPTSTQEANRNSASVHLVSEVEQQANEDIDMDVEMEVDEEPPSSTNCPSPLEQLEQSNQPPLPSDEPSVPPPPDEEWIPPPPPEDEPIPPPPPEEPPLPSIYPDQYNVGYVAPAYDYYSSTAGITSGNYYALAEAAHITKPQPPPYYEPVVTSIFPEVAADVNPVAPIVYYDVTSGAIPLAPVVSSVGSTGYYIQAEPFSYQGSVQASNQSGASGFTAETGSNISLLPKVNPELGVAATASGSQASTLQAAFVASSTQSGGSALGNGSAADALPVTLAKNQTKVARRKKHTVAASSSSRTTYISSLVDKWKAAKEELHSEEDEEPENDYEVLEKKREKEIEKWRARQIASGEAQDNANFLPLGGDWRERVKRKKAKAKTGAVETPKEIVDNENKQPDLVELSKNLPSGWQAYWDVSSKGVYYGNSITSETTWTRPTR